MHRDDRPNTPNANDNDDESNALPFPPSQDTEDDTVQAFEKPGALPDFRHFVDFVDQYLGKGIQLFKKLRKGPHDAEVKEERLAFENLWMLFDSGNTIYCPFRDVAKNMTLYNEEGDDHTPVRRQTPQAYRVVATRGGTMLSESVALAHRQKPANIAMAQSGFVLQNFQGVQVLNQDNKFPEPFSNVWGLSGTPVSRKIRDSYNELQVYCFYIDFDGIKYGIVRDVFIFKPYEGEINIRSLQAYPIQYATNNTLLERGKAFLELTRISHKRYEGLTTGRSREEVRLLTLYIIVLKVPTDPNTIFTFSDLCPFGRSIVR